MTISYPANSRYANCTQASYVAPDGRTIAYVAQRIMPAPERFTPMALHRVIAAERVDLVADRYYGDPEQFWRVCDANRVVWPPDAVSRVDQQVVIPLPLEVASRAES